MEARAPLTKKGLQPLLGKINFMRRFISNLSGKTQAFSPLLRLSKEGFKWGQAQAQQEAFDKIKAYLSHLPILTPPCRNKSMRSYIAAPDKTLGSMLAQEDDNGVERAIYYLSRVLNDVKTRYNIVEKLCLCLYLSCTKLKHYIKLVDVYVSSHFDVIKHMLSKPILYSRIGKWALALTEFSLTYMPLRDVKGQVVTNFIVDHSIDANALHYLEVEPWKLYFDGSSHKEETNIGVLIISPNKIPTRLKYKVEGLCLNNEAEYEALIAGLEANGQVEDANKVIIGLIKKHVRKKPKNWHKTLDKILWACRTSPKESTKSTPFRLTFGHDVVLKIEIHLQSISIQRHHEIPIESYWSMMLDELVYLDEERLNALELLKRRKKSVDNSYNKKVKVKSFLSEDLVWKVILPMDRKDRTLGKWSPKWEDPFQILQVFSNGAYEIEELNEDKRTLRVNGKYFKKYRPVLQEIKIRDE
ncbi:uncharacterized protein LOC127103652 [Lathyrus oleraceus]|uniref:uncharacterized protein LOC127103652 n=1 Tax=Pisum sativum TaxID=3888 RepID=UPI0021D3892A|nr:uncharacterized protein LOC127103652 [Pisum sativum]